ncbi:MAG: type II toxin-antitoxin system Phd/YefM family antitoxin [Acidimicrobiia bacterium]
MSNSINIGEFRQNATEIIRAVETEGKSVTIARRGTPVAELRPIASSPESLAGSVTFVEGVDLTTPIGDPSDWQATR